MSQVSKPAGLTDEQWKVVRVARAGSYSDESARAVIQKLCSVVLELGARGQPLRWEIWCEDYLQARFADRDLGLLYVDDDTQLEIHDQEPAE